MVVFFINRWQEVWLNDIRKIFAHVSIEFLGVLGGVRAEKGPLQRTKVLEISHTFLAYVKVGTVLEHSQLNKANIIDYTSKCGIS